MKLYVVMSRDEGVIFISDDNKKALEIASKQVTQEEMGGGRPSVYIVEKILNK